jgi:hypothetical protein
MAHLKPITTEVRTMTRMFTLAAMLLAVPAARAQLIAYDGFAYTAGQSLNGQNGGSGFTGAWTVSGGTVAVQPGSLTPTAPSNLLATTGNSISATGSTIPGDATRALTTPQGASGTVLWMSTVMKGPGSNATSAGGILALTDGSGNGFTIATGTSGSPGNPPSADWSLTDYFGSTDASSTIPNSVQSLLVARATFGTSTDVIDLFVNPPLTGTAPTTADATLTIPHGPALGILEVNGFSLGSSTNLFDEVRLGGSFADVTPVPEPSTLLLVGVAGFGLIRRRRR